MNRAEVRDTRRRQIIRAAEHLATQRGWTETTFADICQEAGISNGVLTYHFKDKDEIMFAVLNDLIERLRERLQPLFHEETSVQQKIVRTIQAICLPGSDLRLLLLHFIASSTHRPEIAERLHTLFSEMRQRHAARLEPCLSQQGDAQQDALVLVNVLQSLALGIMLSRVFLGIDLPPEQLAEEATKIVLHYLDLQEKGTTRGERTNA
jgi:AcrR family transcriptional regulator